MSIDGVWEELTASRCSPMSIELLDIDGEVDVGEEGAEKLSAGCTAADSSGTSPSRSTVASTMSVGCAELVTAEAEECH